MRVVLLFVAAVHCVLAQTAQCSLSPGAAKLVKTLPSMTDLALSWEERIAPRRRLAESNPNDWALQVLIQDAIRRQFYIGREWDRAIEMYRRLPDRTLGELLEARLISIFQRKRSREMIERVLQRAPDSPWAHLAAVEWSIHPMGRDMEFGAVHLEEFSRLCPDNPRVYSYLDLIQSADRLAPYVQRLRKELEAKKTSGLEETDLALFRAIWPWEKAAAGEGGVGEFRRTVQSDLTTIRDLNLYDSAEWFAVIRMAYDQMLKDSAGFDAGKVDILRRAPRSQSAWRIEEESEDDRPPSPPSRESMERWVAQQKDRVLDRLARFGNPPFARFSVLHVLLNPMSKFEDKDVGRLSDLVLDLAERYPDQGSSWPPVRLMVAELYTRRKLRLDRVPGLVQQALMDIEYQEKHRRDSDAMPAGAGMDNVAITQSRAREVLIRHAIATEQADRARAMLADFRRSLEQTKPASDSTRAAPSWRRDHEVWMELAKLAGIEAVPVAELLPPKPETAERFPVGDFEARDLSGKTWRLADLKGKVAYVNVWTTWCGPCRAEMPGLQKLHDRWKDRKDRVVLTISADFQEALARDFIREHKYTFPVVHGSAVAEKFFPPILFPQNWLIDPEGRRLSVKAPPPYDTTIAQIEELAGKLSNSGQ